MRKDGVFRVGLSYLFLTTALFLVLGSIASASDAFRWNLGDSTLILSEDGKSQLLRADGSPVYNNWRYHQTNEGLSKGNR